MKAYTCYLQIRFSYQNRECKFFIQLDKKESTNRNEKTLCIGSDPLCRKTYDPKLLAQELKKEVKESLKVDKVDLGQKKELVLDLKSLDVANLKDVSCGFETYHCNYKINYYNFT